MLESTRKQADAITEPSGAAPDARVYLVMNPVRLNTEVGFSIWRYRARFCIDCIPSIFDGCSLAKDAS